MSTNEPPHAKQQYVMDPELAAEMVRLRLQGAFLTQEMGGVLPEQHDLSAIHEVLDLACGSGEWVLTLALEHPEMQVIGVDVSETMIEYATVQTEMNSLPNASFQIMDVLAHPLPFVPASFDLVNMRLGFAFMRPEDWIPLLTECIRILRPGGIIRLTECERTLSNNPTFEHYMSLWSQAFKKAGRTFSPDGLHYGLLPVLKHLLKQAGYREIRHVAYLIDISADTEGHPAYFENVLTLLQDGMPFFVKMGNKQAELDRLYDALQAMQGQEDFYGYWPLMSIWGTKPEQK